VCFGFADDRGKEVAGLRGELLALQGSLEAAERAALELKERLESSEAERGGMEEALSRLRGGAEAGDVATSECVRRVEEGCVEAEEAVCALREKVEQVSECFRVVFAEAVF
jgi:hypothetical protein